MANTYTQIHRYGTQAQYDALATKNPNYLYFTSDTNKLYKGEVDYTDSLIKITTVPATGVAGKIYFEQSTGQVKAYVDGAWTVISYPIVTEIDVNADDAHIPTASAVKDYVDDIVGGDGVVANVENGTAAGKLKITMGNGSTSEFGISGATLNPTWNEITRQLTLPVMGANGTVTNVVANIGKDIFLESGRYDSAAKEIVLVLNDDNETEIRIPASALYNDYTGGETATIDVDIDGTTHEITATAKISSTAGNALTSDANGLYISLEAYATTAAVDARFTTVENTLNGATADIATLKGDYQTAGSVDYKIYNASTATSLKIADHETRIASLESDMTQAQSDITANAENIAALATAATSWAPFADSE